MRVTALALTLAVLTVALPRAAVSQCADWSQQPTILPNATGDFARIGNLVYSMGRNSTLYVLDVTDRLHPVEVGSVAASAGSEGIDAQGSWLYVATPGGADVFDLSNPLAPVLVHTIATPTAVVDVGVDGTTLWALSRLEFRNYDVINPLSEVLVHAEPALADTSAGGLYHSYCGLWPLPPHRPAPSLTGVSGSSAARSSATAPSIRRPPGP